MSATLEHAPVVFEVPGGELSFVDGALDMWAEHLAWCYRMLGVDDGATFAVQDFGTSPLAYLGSSLLMPTLEKGVAERLGGKLICLDASPERIVITPDALRQVQPDVLVVRADVLGLLLDGSNRAGVDLTRVDGLDLIVAVGGDAMPLPPGEFKRILHVEAPLLLAPECDACGCFHLRDGYYELREGEIRNLRQAGTQPCRPRGLVEVDASCAHGAGDVLIQTGAS